MFAVPAVAGSLAIIGLLIILPDRRLTTMDKPTFSPADFARSFWISPRQHPDFAWAFASRFLVILAASTFLTYQPFYLTHQLGYATSDVPRLVFLGTLVQAPLVVAASLLAGKLSDLMERRKVFVIVSAIIFGVGLLVQSAAHSLAQFLVGLAIAGVGSGANLAVSLALAVDVLPPDESAAAKNLGVYNIATTMPQMLMPAIAPGVLAVSGGSYAWLFAVLGLLAAAGGVCIQPVRGVR
jgi:MFS family permease